MTPQNKVQAQGVGSVSADNANTFVQWTTNLASLRGFVGIDTMQVYLQGYQAAGDGGQGNFAWNANSTGPDNGTSVIVPVGVTQGAWVRDDATGSATVLYYTAAFEFIGAVTPGASQIIGLHTLTTTVTFPPNWSGLAGALGGYVHTPFTSNYTFTVQDQAANPLGNVTITSGGAFSGTTTSGLPFTLFPGNTLVCVGNATPDATGADFSWSFPGIVL